MKKLLTILICLPGCLAEPTAEDGRDDSFTGAGKGDDNGIGEGSYEALAILDLANTESPERLLEPAPAGVGLSEKVVDNLVNLRLGDDGRPGTDDDGWFSTLADLDAVPFVGPLAFDKMRIHVATHPRCFLENFGDDQRWAAEMMVTPAHVYFMGDSNTHPMEIWRASKTMFGIDLVASLYPRNEDTPAMAVDATHFYIANGLTLERRPFGPGAAEVVAQAVGSMGAVATDATHIYFGDDVAIYRRAKSGGMPELLHRYTMQAQSFRPVKIVVDGNTVYWKSDGGATLSRVTIGNQTKTVIANYVKDFAVDATHIYILTDNSSTSKDDVLERKVKSLLAPPEDIVSFSVGAFTLDDTRIIFSQPDGIVLRNKVMKVDTKFGLPGLERSPVRRVGIDANHVYVMGDAAVRARRDHCKL